MNGLKEFVGKTGRFGKDLKGMLGPVGVCAYIVGFAVPFDWNLPLFVLAAATALTTIFDYESKQYALDFSLMIPILIFLGITGLSTFTSTDISRSLQLSTPLLPSVLLFMLIAVHFRRIEVVHLFYLTLSIVGAGLALSVLFANGEGSPDSWLNEIANPIIVVPNDLTFLSLLTPFSFVLLYREPRSLSGIVAGLSILLSVIAIVIVQSRVALLTMLVSMGCTTALIRPRLVLTVSIATILLMLVIDSVLGFSLSTKFGNVVDTRVVLWGVALSAFADAPLLGHGPHTFTLFYHDYLNELSIPSWLPIDVRRIPWAHSLYMEMLSEQGLLGFCGLGFLLFRGLSLAWSLRHAAGDVGLFAVSGFAGLVGFCFASLFELTMLRLWVVVVMFSFLGVIASLSSIQENEIKE